MALTIRALEPRDVPRCAEILHGLPEWFGIDSANRAYVDALGQLPGAVACQDAELVGFIALGQHNARSYEIHVMAVDRTFHNRGAGKALIRWAEAYCAAHSAPWLHVKTRGPSTPDAEYEGTRRFYKAVGFDALFESRDLWGPQDAALILVKHLPQG